MANRNFFNNKLYQFEVYPVLLSCQFTVAPADSAGLGITGLKGAGIKNVFMHTSSTPGSGNPNPASGLILVQLQDNYYKWLGGFSSNVAAPTGGNLTLSSGSLVQGTAYVITGLGTTTTAANWVSAGVPAGVTAAVGVPFVATAAAHTGTGLGNATVKAIGTSGVSSIELIGDPSLTLNPIGTPSAPLSGGGWLMFQCLGQSLTMNSYTPAGTNDSASPPIFTGTPATLTGSVAEALAAPATGSIISLAFYLSNSSVTVSGQ